MLPQPPNISWRDESMSVATLSDKVESETYDVNPPHQRDYVHNLKWKQELIETVFTFGKLPGVFWHPQPTSQWKLESLDGKQRVLTLVDFYRNKFKWRGYLFKELNSELQTYYSTGFSLTHSIANLRLNPEQISTLFKKFQITKVTTKGELLHSMQHLPVINAILTHMSQCKHCNEWAIMKRYDGLCIFFQCLLLLRGDEMKDLTFSKYDARLRDNTIPIATDDEIGTLCSWLFTFYKNVSRRFTGSTAIPLVRFMVQNPKHISFIKKHMNDITQEWKQTESAYVEKRWKVLQDFWNRKLVEKLQKRQKYFNK